jgi:mRNA interferase RelE/StbE
VSQRYRLRIARPAARAVTEILPEKVAAAAYGFITGPLLDNPHRVGKPLNPPMAPAWTARRGTYRILYLIDERAGIVEVTAIRHRIAACRYHYEG